MHTCNYKIVLSNMVKRFGDISDLFRKELASVPWHRPVYRIRVESAIALIDAMHQEGIKIVKLLSGVDHDGPRPQGGANA